MSTSGCIEKLRFWLMISVNEFFKKFRSISCLYDPLLELTVILDFSRLRNTYISCLRVLFSWQQAWFTRVEGRDDIVRRESVETMDGEVEGERKTKKSVESCECARRLCALNRFALLSRSTRNFVSVDSIFHAPASLLRVKFSVQFSVACTTWSRVLKRKNWIF